MYQKATKIVLSLGVLLATIQYLSGRSIWLDEAKLALNILDRSYIALLSPLHSNQVAPILFLWVERFFIDLFGVNDYSLRLFPFLAFLGAVCLLYRLLPLLFYSRRWQFVVATLFAFSQPVIYFASELKQYMVDVLVVLLLLYLVLYPFKSHKRQLFALSIAGMLSIALSNIAVIVLFTIGLYGWLSYYRRRANIWNAFLIPIGCWILAFGAYYAMFIYEHPNRALMLPFWEFAFMPSNPFSALFWEWSYDSYTMVFGKIIGANPKIPLLYHGYGIAYIVGVYAFAKAKNYQILFLTITPIVLHLLLSMLSLYPFARRTAFYLMPLLIMICAKGFVFGMDSLWSLLSLKKMRWAYALPGLALLTITLYTFPKEREPFKRTYKFMHNRVQANDIILLNGATDNAWEYYERTGYVDLSNKVIKTGQHSYDFDAHKPGLDTLSGRVWLFYTHDHTDKEKYKMLESRFMIQHLKERGQVLDSVRDISAGAYIFDL
ncbi:MAG: hypothetical protein CL867_04245 [Cytophagaceae bacterium]|nr:hypothetical protein [Cytophagaceae bacterium]